MPTKTQENVLPIEGSGRVVARHDRRIGTLLVEAGKLGARDIEQVMDLQQKEALRFGEAAHRLGLITENDLQGALAKQYDFPRLLPGNERINSELVVASDPFHPRAEELWALRTQDRKSTRLNSSHTVISYAVFCLKKKKKKKRIQK